VREPKGKQIED